MSSLAQTDGKVVLGPGLSGKVDYSGEAVDELANVSIDYLKHVANVQYNIDNSMNEGQLGKVAEVMKNNFTVYNSSTQFNVYRDLLEGLSTKVGTVDAYDGSVPRSSNDYPEKYTGGRYPYITQTIDRTVKFSRSTSWLDFFGEPKEEYRREFIQQRLRFIRGDARSSAYGTHKNILSTYEERYQSDAEFTGAAIKLDIFHPTYTVFQARVLYQTFIDLQARAINEHHELMILELMVSASDRGEYHLRERLGKHATSMTSYIEEYIIPFKAYGNKNTDNPLEAILDKMWNYMEAVQDNGDWNQPGSGNYAIFTHWEILSRVLDKPRLNYYLFRGGEKTGMLGKMYQPLDNAYSIPKYNVDYIPIRNYFDPGRLDGWEPLLSHKTEHFLYMFPTLMDCIEGGALWPGNENHLVIYQDHTQSRRVIYLKDAILAYKKTMDTVAPEVKTLNAGQTDGWSGNVLDCYLDGVWNSVQKAEKRVVIRGGARKELAHVCSAHQVETLVTLIQGTPYATHLLGGGGAPVMNGGWLKALMNGLQYHRHPISHLAGMNDVIDGLGDDDRVTGIADAGNEHIIACLSRIGRDIAEHLRPTDEDHTLRIEMERLRIGVDDDNYEHIRNSYRALCVLSAIAGGICNNLYDRFGTVLSAFGVYNDGHKPHWYIDILPQLANVGIPLPVQFGLLHAVNFEVAATVLANSQAITPVAGKSEIVRVDSYTKTSYLEWEQLQGLIVNNPDKWMSMPDSDYQKIIDEGRVCGIVDPEMYTKHRQYKTEGKMIPMIMNSDYNSVRYPIIPKMGDLATTGIVMNIRGDDAEKKFFDLDDNIAWKRHVENMQDMDEANGCSMYMYFRIKALRASRWIYRAQTEFDKAIWPSGHEYAKKAMAEPMKTVFESLISRKTRAKLYQM